MVVKYQKIKIPIIDANHHDLLEIVGYNEMSNETTAPTGQRRVALFEVNRSSNLSFTNYTFVYDF